MSHLQRRYTDYFYVNSGRGEKKHLQKKEYMKRDEFMKLFPFAQIPGANGVFPCNHEERDFLSKKKKRNNTRTRMKRRNKARVRARISK